MKRTLLYTILSDFTKDLLYYFIKPNRIPVLILAIISVDTNDSKSNGINLTILPCEMELRGVSDFPER